MKKIFFIVCFLCFAKGLYPYTATNVASITATNFATITTNAVDIFHGKYGFLKGTICNTLNNEVLQWVKLVLGSSTGSSTLSGTYSIWTEIRNDNEKSTFTAEKGDYYKKEKLANLSSSTTKLDAFLCPKKREIPNYSWKMVSFPVEPSGNSIPGSDTLTIGDDLGKTDQDTWRAYIWDEDNSSDDYLSKYRNPGTITSGLSYWFKYYKDGTISLFTEGTPTSATLTVPLKKGWNMVGNPGIFKLAKNRLNVRVATSTYPLGSYTEEKFWGYDGNYNDEEILLPHYGYWLKAIEPCSLLFPWTEWDDKATLSKIGLMALEDNYVKIIARSSIYQDAVIFGISKDASDKCDFGIDISKPPMPLDLSLYLAFTGNGNALAKDIRQEDDDITWNLSIMGTNSPIELSFEGIDGIDKKYNVFLVDGNNIFDLRKEKHYTLNAPRPIKIRLIEEGLIIQENRIVKLLAYPNPSDSNLTFQVGLRAKGAGFRVTIYNIVGQKVYEGDLLPSASKSWGRFSKEDQAYIYESEYKGRGSHNLPLACGLYIYEVKSYALNSETKGLGKFIIKR